MAGGLLDEVYRDSQLLSCLAERRLVTTKGKIKQASNTYKTLREPLDLDIPIGCIWSMAERLLRQKSLRALCRTLTVRSLSVTVRFGKGLVQTTRPLPYGGTMKLTTSKYYIPSGRCVQAIDYKHRNEDGSVGTYSG